jgi:hypothetical protein
MFRAAGIHYEIAERTRAMGCGGLGAIHTLAREVGLIEGIDRRLHLLKIHLPYHESDHVLNLAYNLLAGGQCLEDLERLRNDEVYLDGLGAQRIPDPTTAGDFCRRFAPSDVETLLETIQQARARVWARQPDAFFDKAVLDVDGTLVPTSAECKAGMDIAHEGTWGFHPLRVSLANTQEPLRIENRSGNRPSHENAAARIDQAARWCREAGFRAVRVRGDTDFSQTRHLDRWDAASMEFVFGIDAMANLVAIASGLRPQDWQRLARPAKYERSGPERKRPPRVKEQIVQTREFENLRLLSEDVADFAYRPTACRQDYRMVVVRKNLSVERGEKALFEDVRYFFYITNDWDASRAEIVFDANDRCDQENLIAQLKSGVRALRAPVSDLESNWAYMVMASLAWTLKAWFALCLPERGRWAQKYAAEKRAVLRMEFRSFVNAFIRIPVQIVRQARRVIYRVLAWNRSLAVFFRAWDAIPSRC